MLSVMTPCNMPTMIFLIKLQGNMDVFFTIACSLSLCYWTFRLDESFTFVLNVSSASLLLCLFDFERNACTISQL